MCVSHSDSVILYNNQVDIDITAADRDRKYPILSIFHRQHNKKLVRHHKQNDCPLKPNPRVPLFTIVICHDQYVRHSTSRATTRRRHSKSTIIYIVNTIKIVRPHQVDTVFTFLYIVHFQLNNECTARQAQLA